MANLMPVVSAMLFGYLSALAGVAVGLLLSRLWRRKGEVSSTEALVCVLMPAICLGIFTAVANVPLLQADLPQPLDEPWHRAIHAVTHVPVLHELLHIMMLGAVVAAFAGLVRVVVFIYKHLSLASSLKNASGALESRNGIPFYRLASDQPYCFSIGAINPRIYVADCLIDQLPDEEFEAVLAHELAHGKRCDGLANLIVNTIYHAFVLPGGSALCRQWRRAAERACDLSAAKAGHPCNVASALVRVAQLGIQRPLHGELAFTAGDESIEDIEARVQALLEDARPPAARPGRTALFAVCVLVSVVAVFEPVFRHTITTFVYH